MKRISKGIAIVLVPFALVLLAMEPALAATYLKLVSPSAFEPISNYVPSDVMWGSTVASISNNSSSTRDGWFTAPVLLPVGAVVTQLAYISMNPTGGTSQATLFRAKGWGTAMPLEVARVSTSNPNSNWQEFVIDATSIKVIKGDLLYVTLKLAPNTSVRAVKVTYRR